jgi:hypothetical protein
MKLQRRDNLDNVLVLSYTEFVRQPVRGRGSCVKNGAHKRKTISSALGGGGGHAT